MVWGAVDINYAAPPSYPVVWHFDKNELVRLSAKPAKGYEFCNWSGDLESVENPITFRPESDKAIVANFRRITHSTIIQVSGNGSTTPASGAYLYGEGSVVGITAVPDRGWKFDRWTGSVVDTGSANTSVIADSDKTVTAVFVEDGLDIKVIGTISGVIGLGLTFFFVKKRKRTRSVLPGLPDQ